MPPPDEPNHPWRGLSEFKSGFSGTPTEYTGTWEIALSPTASRVLNAWQQAGVRTERLALRLRLAVNRSGQSPEGAGTSAPRPSAQPMAPQAERELNT